MSIFKGKIRQTASIVIINASKSVKIRPKKWKTAKNASKCIEKCHKTVTNANVSKAIKPSKSHPKTFQTRQNPSKFFKSSLNWVEMCEEYFIVSEKTLNFEIEPRQNKRFFPRWNLMHWIPNFLSPISKRSFKVQRIQLEKKVSASHNNECVCKSKYAAQWVNCASFVSFSALNFQLGVFPFRKMGRFFPLFFNLMCFWCILIKMKLGYDPLVLNFFSDAYLKNLKMRQKMANSSRKVPNTSEELWK